MAIWPVTADSTVGMGMTESVDRETGQQIEIPPPLGVPDVAALAADEDPLGRRRRCSSQMCCTPPAPPPTIRMMAEAGTAHGSTVT